MNFVILPNNNLENCSLYYREEQHSFEIHPFPGGGFTSILINCLNLEVDDNGVILYAWGYCPIVIFNEVKNEPRDYSQNRIKVVTGKELIPGVSHRFNDNEIWPLFLNKKKGWICIGNPDTDGLNLVEFAPSCVAGLQEDQIKSIWLRPIIIPT